MPTLYLPESGKRSLGLPNKSDNSGTSLEVQWLRLRSSEAGGAGSIPGPGAKIPHAPQPKKKNQTITPTSVLTMGNYPRANKLRV